MGRVRKVKLDYQSVRFVKINKRKLVCFDVDLTISNSDIQKDLIVGSVVKKAKNAIVKLRVKYFRGDDEKANELINNFMLTMKDVASHIFKPETIVINKNVARIPELSTSIDPLEAIEIWLKKYPPSIVSLEEVRKKVIKYIKNWSIVERPLPLLQAVRGIAIQGFMPFFRLQVIDNISDGVLGIIGLNRSGKSALLEAMLYVLRGEGRRLPRSRTKNDYIHHDSKFLELEAKISILNKEKSVMISRFRDRKNVSEVRIDNRKYNVTNGDQEISDLIHIDLDTFLQTAFVRQGDLHGLLDYSSSKLKDEVMRWIGSDVWLKAHDMIVSDIKDINKEVERINGKIELLQEVIEEGRPKVSEIKKIKSKLSLLYKHRAGDAEIELELHKLDEEMDYVKKYCFVEEEVKKLNKVRSDVGEKSIKLKLIDKKISKFNSKLSVINADIEKRQSYMKEFDGKCPIDFVICPRENDINHNRKIQIDKINVLHVKQKKIMKLLNKISKERDIIEEEHEDRKKEVDELINKKKWLMNNEKPNFYGLTYNELLVKLERKKQRLKDKVEEDLSNRISVLEDKLRDLQFKSKRYMDSRREYNEYEETIEERKWELLVLKYIEYMVSKRGIPSMQIENALLGMESQINSILDIMETSHKLEFSFETETTKKALMCYGCGHIYEDGKKRVCPICRKVRGKERTDELSILVRDAGKLQHFSQDSGGGKALLAFAVRVALARFFGIKVLFLDEVCGSLDDENLQRLIKMINKLPELGFVQVFVISHRTEVANALSRNILVVRYPHKGYSVLSWDV